MITQRRLLFLAPLLLMVGCGGPEQQVLGQWRNEQQGIQFEFLRNGQVVGGGTLSYQGTWTVAENGDIVITFPYMTLRGQVSGDQLTLSAGDPSDAMVLTRVR